jgi:hypothetical protein
MSYSDRPPPAPEHAAVADPAEARIRNLVVDRLLRMNARTRLVNDAGDIRALPRLLFRLADLARDRYAGTRGFDPRDVLANRQDAMGPHATYIGVGVSSLDSASGTWEQIQQSASGPSDVPGRCFVLLGDGTHVLVDRGNQDAYGEVRLASTHDFNLEYGLASRRWVWRPDLATSSGTAEVWPRLAELHQLIVGQSPRRT